MRESAIDSLLIRYAGIKSPNDIAAETGLEPEDVARRTQELLDRVTLTEEEVFAKLMFQMQEQIAKMAERVENASNEDAARLSNTLAGLAGRILKAQDDRKKALEKGENRERDAVFSRSLVMLVEMATYGLLEYVAQEYPEIEPQPLKQKFGELLANAAQEIA
jgi:dGTP triphosphohydrolase